MDNPKTQGRPGGFVQSASDSQLTKYPTSHAMSPTTGAVLNAKKSPGKKKKKKDASQNGILFVFAIILAATGVLVAINVFFGNRGVNIQGKSGNGALETSSDNSSKKNRFQKQGASRKGKGILALFAPASDKLIREVMAEKGMPEQMFQRDVPASENVGAQLAREFTTFLEEGNDKKLREGISTSGEWNVDQETLQNMESVIDSFKPQRDRIRDFLNDPKAKFEQDMRTTEDGLVPDEKNIDQSWSYMTLEECAIAEALNEGNIDAAVESILYMFRFTELSANAKFPTMRIQAAYMRENVFRILQTLTNHPDFDKSHAEKVIRSLRQQLKNWPPDYQCWVGDRADGMRFFEAISQGRLEQTLNEDDLNQLRRLDPSGREKTSSRGTDLLGRVAFYKTADCDADLAFYLQSMKKLIDAGTKPFYSRIATLNEVEDALQAKRGSKDFPAISMLLLQGIRPGMQQQALDKARIEVWYLALALSLKHNAREDSLDPVSGKPYHITRSTTEQGDVITVSNSSENIKAQVRAYQ